MKHQPKVKLRGCEELQGALQAWQGVLPELLSLPRKEPPGKLGIRDLERLVKERLRQHELLLDMEADLTDYAPLLGRGSMATKLVGVTEQARKVVSFSVMLSEVLCLYSDVEAVRVAVGLDKDWLGLAQESYQEMDRRLEGMVGLAMGPR